MRHDWLSPLDIFTNKIFHDFFSRHIKVVLKNMIGDGRCSIHQSVLGSRPGRSGWFELCAPWGKDGEGPDGGTELHCEMVCIITRCVYNIIIGYNNWIIS